MSSKVRVYEVARDLGMDNRALVVLLQSVGVTEVRNHMSAIALSDVERVKRHLEKQQNDQKVVEERIRPTVVKRRSVRKRPEVVAEAKPNPEPLTAPVNGVQPQGSDVAPSAASPSAPASSIEPAGQAEAAVARNTDRTPSPTVASSSLPATAVAPQVTQVSENAPGQDLAEASAPTTETNKAELTPSGPQTTPEASSETKVDAAPAVAAAPVAAPVVPNSATAPGATPVKSPAPAAVAPRTVTSPPKTGIDVWEGRPGVPMPKPPQRPAMRRVQYDAKAGAGGAPGGAPRHRGGPMGNRMGRGGMRHRGIGSLGRAKGTGGPVTQERSAHKKVVRIEESISLQALSGKMGVKATELLMKLMRLGMTGVNINSTLDADTAKIVANDFGWEVEDVAVSDEDALIAAQGGVLAEEEDGTRESRPPVVTVMGHVDHGKTSLLDQIRSSRVVEGEAGGITQHIGAYSVETPHGPITFLDTPGHSAFTAMRARGVRTTDIVILVVAADDGVMPQTKEAINHAKAAKVPIVVAVNKCDKVDAQPERVRREISELGLVPEEWGGDTLFAEVSATTRMGVDALLEQIVLQAEVMELRASAEKPAAGVVVEAQLDRGRGPVATVLVTDGTLHRGDIVVCGVGYGKVRAMQESSGRQVASAGPSVPVSVIGLSDVPSAGDSVHVVKDLKRAQEITESRKTKERRGLPPGTGKRPTSLEDVARAMKEADQLDMRLIIKADVQGSVEALADAVSKLGTEKVRVTVVHSAVGAITEGDVNLAVASGALIIGFRVRPAGKATALAQKEGVEIRQYAVIYEILDDVTAAMEGMLAPEKVEKTIGSAEVRQIFKITKAGIVAGSMVIQGAVRRTAPVRLLRDGAEIWQGKLASLKRFKEDVKEVKEGFDCGLALDGFSDVAVGDIVEAFEIEEIKQKL